MQQSINYSNLHAENDISRLTLFTSKKRYTYYNAREVDALSQGRTYTHNNAFNIVDRLNWVAIETCMQ